MVDREGLRQAGKQAIENVRAIGSVPGRLAGRRPGLYVGLLTLFAGLGYLYLFLFPVLPLALAMHLPDAIGAARGAIDWLWVGVAVLVMLAAAWLTYGLARLQLRPPAGRPLLPDEAPALFELIEEVRPVYRAPRLHDVRITEGFGVRLVRTPIGGLPLLFRHTLVLGLPAIQSLAPFHFQALLARNVGRAPGGRARLVRWLAHLPGLWQQYAAAKPDVFPLGIVLRLLFPWYARIYRWAAVGAVRLDELERDRHLLEHINHEDVAEAIAAWTVAERFLEQRYWPAILAQAAGSLVPVGKPYTRLNQAPGARPAETEQWLKEAMAEESDPRRLAPTLRERLDNIGHGRIRAPAPAATRAADLLGDVLPVLTQQMDALWEKKVAAAWRERHAQGKQARTRLAQLQPKARTGRLQADELKEYLALANTYLSRAELVAACREVLRARPDDARLHFALGRLLAGQGQREGIEMLECAMALDKQLVAPACRLISAFSGTPALPSGAAAAASPTARRA